MYAIKCEKDNCSCDLEFGILEETKMNECNQRLGGMGGIGFAHESKVQASLPLLVLQRRSRFFKSSGVFIGDVPVDVTLFESRVTCHK